MVRTRVNRYYIYRAEIDVDLSTFSSSLFSRVGPLFLFSFLLFLGVAVVALLPTPRLWLLSRARLVSFDNTFLYIIRYPSVGEETSAGGERESDTTSELVDHGQSNPAGQLKIYT